MRRRSRSLQNPRTTEKRTRTGKDNTKGVRVWCVPSTTFPKTTCFLFNQVVLTVVMKNWEPLVLGPKGHMSVKPQEQKKMFSKMRKSQTGREEVWWEARTRVSHGEISRSFMVQFKVFIIKFVSINRFTSYKKKKLGTKQKAKERKSYQFRFLGWNLLLGAWTQG